MVVRVQHAAGLGNAVGAQDHRFADRDVLAEALVHDDVDAELLTKFPNQGRRLGLSRRNFAAGQFPQSGQLRRTLPLRQQHRRPDQRAGHDNLNLGGHRSRRYTVSVMAVLSDEQVAAAVADLDGWEHTGGTLRRAVTFPSFIGGIDAVRTVAELAEQADHHPDIDICWRTVTFTLVTHSAGGITDKDVALAGQINIALASQINEALADR